jgi:hypothetical protein
MFFLLFYRKYWISDSLNINDLKFTVCFSDVVVSLQHPIQHPNEHQLSANVDPILTEATAAAAKAASGSRSKFQFVANWRKSSTNKNKNKIKNVNKSKNKRQRKNKRALKNQVNVSSSDQSKSRNTNFVLEPINNFNINASSSSSNRRKPISWGALQTRKYFESSLSAERFLVQHNQSSFRQSLFSRHKNCNRSVIKFCSVLFLI